VRTHGTRSCYKNGCRCDLCKAEDLRKQRERRMRARMTPQTYVPCPHCGDDFCQGQGLTGHIRRMHPEALDGV
jgi:hypothetical protein